MRISRAVFAPMGASEEMEVAISDLLPVSNLWCIADKFAKKIQWIYAKGYDTYAIFADSDTDLGFKAFRISLGKNCEADLDCKIIDLHEYMTTNEYADKFNSEREAIAYLVENWGEAIASPWEISEEAS